MMRPKAINLFEMLGWGATGLGALSVFIRLIQVISQRPGPGAYGYLLILFVLLIFAGLGVATFYAAKRRHQGGRWGFIVTAAVVASMVVPGAGDVGMGGEGMALLFLVLDMLILATAMGATICLAQPEAGAWFALGPIQPAPRPIAQPPFPGYGAPTPGASQYPPVGYPPATSYPPAAYPPAAPDLSKPVAMPAQPVADPAASEAMRRCPYCAEEIKAEASKCRFCGSSVDPAPR